MDTLLIILIVILIIVIMVRGPKTLPLIGGMLGRGREGDPQGGSEIQKERDAATAAPRPAHRPTRRPAAPDPPAALRRRPRRPT